jgi:phage recombination protein Bet
MNNMTAINTANEIDLHIWSALKNSLYIGARDESIKMVLDYCKAAKLDPMQKPVHIVPMSVKNALTGKYEYKDVVMPGVGLYRIQAARSNQYAGVSEPEFGEDVTCNLGGADITYPKWCKVTVKKIVNNTIVEFTAKEYWLENYASKKDELTPNTMWRKRPYGQLAKCAEAQALRKAFPEIISQHPTAEEMEGKYIKTIEEEQPSQHSSKTDMLKSYLETKEKLVESDYNAADNGVFYDGYPEEEQKKTLVNELRTLILSKNIPTETTAKWLDKAHVDNISDLGISELEACIDFVKNKYE